MLKKIPLWMIGLWLIIILLLIVVALQPLLYHLSNLTFIDDGFYYLSYARNIATGNGPTFDGLVETNGVQPLWTVLLILVATFQQDDLALMQSVMILATILISLTLPLMADILGRWFDGWALNTTLLVYTGLIASPLLFFSGMETPIILLTVVLSLWVILRIHHVSMRQTLLAGCVLSLVPLARIDMLLLMPSFALVLIYANGSLREKQWKQAILSVIWLAIPVTFVFLAYIAFNLTVFGIPLPFSGTVKTTWHSTYVASMGGHFSISHLLETTTLALEQIPITVSYYFTMLLWSFSSLTLVIRILIIGLLIALLVTIIRRRRSFLRRLHTIRQVPLLPLIVVCLIGSNLLLQTWLSSFLLGDSTQVWTWYYVGWYVFLTPVCGWLIMALVYVLEMPTLQRWIPRVLTAMLVFALLLYTRTFTNYEGVKPFRTHYDAVVWANENIPSDDVIGSLNAGVLGYFSDQAVINLDGLMNNRDLLPAIENRLNMGAYMRDHNIRWFIDYVYNPITDDTEYVYGIPREWVRVVYEKPFNNFGFIPSIYYILEINYPEAG